MRNRFQFTLRDLFWLTLLVAGAVAWWLDHRAMEERRIEATQKTQQAVDQAARLRKSLSHSKNYIDQLFQQLASPSESGMVDIHGILPNFAPLDEQPIEP